MPTIEQRLASAERELRYLSEFLVKVLSDTEQLVKPKTEIKIGQVWREKRPFAHMAWHREVRVTEMAYVPHNSSDMGDRRWRKRE